MKEARTIFKRDLQSQQDGMDFLSGCDNNIKPARTAPSPAGRRMREQFENGLTYLKTDKGLSKVPSVQIKSAKVQVT